MTATRCIMQRTVTTVVGVVLLAFVDERFQSHQIVVDSCIGEKCFFFFLYFSINLLWHCNRSLITCRPNAALEVHFIKRLSSRRWFTFAHAVWAMVSMQAVIHFVHSLLFIFPINSILIPKSLIISKSSIIIVNPHSRHRKNTIHVHSHL